MSLEGGPARKSLEWLLDVTAAVLWRCTTLVRAKLFEHRIQTPAEEAVVKAGRRPPRGLGLDDGAPAMTPARIEEEPRQGRLGAPGRRRIALSNRATPDWLGQLVRLARH
jgi:hypothetical protein